MEYDIKHNTSIVFLKMITFHNLNRLDNLTVESTAERSNILDSIFVMETISDWHQIYLKHIFQKYTRCYDIHKSTWRNGRSTNET